MPNLNNIFNNFFPQSQTGKKGLFLLRMAWTIEIFVAIVGFIIGLIIMKGSQSVEGTSQSISGFGFLGNMTLNDFSIGLIFMIVAVVELTKIPLATAVYYSVRLSWRLLFILGLLLVNVSTFETIVTGFERINRERTKIVGDYITTYHSILNQIEHLSLDQRSEEIDEDIEELIEQRSKIQTQIDKNNLSAEKQIKSLQESSANKDIIKQLNKQIDGLKQDIEKLTRENSKLAKDQKGAWAKKVFTDQIKANNDFIKQKNEEKQKLETKVSELIKEGGQDIAASIDLIRNSAQIKNKPLNGEIKMIGEKLRKLDQRKLDKADIEANKDIKIDELNNQKLELIRKIDEVAPDNQVFRVATWLRGWFEINYEEEIRKLNKQIFELENMKIADTKQPNWFQKLFPFFYDDNSFDNSTIDKQIKSLEKQIDIFERKSDLKAESTQTSIYADIPKGALIAAFWLWFGVLSFIISVVGTLLAFASLVLLDPRLHKIRNKKSRWKGVAERISLLLFTIRRYIHGRVHRLRDPVIKKVEVIKEVPKEVEKTVFKDKVVYVDKEIPVKGDEIIKHHYVYVPFPTDDEELLKKGPFSAPNYEKKDDKDKKK
jgi:hypothetical protein